MTAPTREEAEALDAADPLAEFAGRFLPILDPGVVAYLDGNSLGRPPAATLERLEQLVRKQWGSRMIRGWSEGWFDLPTSVGDRLARVVLESAPGQVIVGDSTTVWLYKLLRAAVGASGGRTEIVTDTGNFPTDRYVVEGIADELGCTIRWLETDPALGVVAGQVADVVGDDTAVVTFSHVAYRSAFIADLPEITAIAHEAGAFVLWDLCHSAGAMPIRLDGVGVDFAVGCTYKFLNAGPGAPAFAYVRRDHIERVRQPVWGWVGHEDRFGMPQGYRPAADIARLASGTPPIVGLAGVSEGIALVEQAGIERIRAKGVVLTEFAIALFDAWLAPLRMALASPRDPKVRGCHVTLAHPDAKRLADELVARGVIVDHREPHGIRLGLSPLTTGFTELWRAMTVIRDTLNG